MMLTIQSIFSETMMNNQLIEKLHVLFNSCKMFLFLIVFNFGYAINAQEIDLPFSSWLMNNEAKTLSILAADKMLIDKISMPFGMLVYPSAPSPLPEEALWGVHRIFFKQLPEMNKIFQLTNMFGSEKFQKLFENVHPGKWITLTLLGVFPAKVVCEPLLEQNFCEALLLAMGIQKNQGIELDKKLQSIFDAISDSDRRTLTQYIDTFLALYPNNKPTRILADLIKSGLRKESIKGITALLSDIKSGKTGRPKKISPSAGLASDFETSFDSPDNNGNNIDLSSGADITASDTLDSGAGQNASQSTEDVFNIF